MEIVHLSPADVQIARDCTHLFDAVPLDRWIEKFLAEEGHHLFVALDGSGMPAIGFVTGVEMTHPDKGTEMFLYELAVAETRRNEGIGRALVRALADLARDLGCYGMWVGTEPSNAAALACYRAAGASAPEPFVTLEWAFAER